MDYVEVAEARERTGLRLVLTAGAPGPWGEAAKALFHVKGLEYVPVRQTPGEADAALREWTGQTSAPVAIWNDEPPCATSRQILWLAERLRPEPALVPSDDEERTLCLGLCDEIHGENGLGWCRRLQIFEPVMRALGEAARETPIGFMAWKYGYSAEAVGRAEARVVQIVRYLGRRLAEQRSAGRRYLVGDNLTAADVHWATFAAMLSPLSPDRCPMDDRLREFYTVREGPVAEAMDPDLLAHRDFVYERHLSLPLDF